VSGDLATRVIVLNGGSSSGKSSIARVLLELLPGLWLTFGVDAFIDALPGRGGAPLIFDEVFLRGSAAQAAMRVTMDGLGVLWVGVHCDPAAEGDPLVALAFPVAALLSPWPSPLLEQC
jgi:chloramphenicol 3-O phosphotransferase